LVLITIALIYKRRIEMIQYNDPREHQKVIFSIRANDVTVNIFYILILDILLL